MKTVQRRIQEITDDLGDHISNIESYFRSAEGLVTIPVLGALGNPPRADSSVALGVSQLGPGHLCMLCSLSCDPHGEMKALEVLAANF